MTKIIYQVFIFDDIFSQAHSYAIQAYMAAAERYRISTSPKLSLKAHHDADLIKITRFGQLLNKAVLSTKKFVFIFFNSLLTLLKLKD